MRSLRLLAVLASAANAATPTVTLRNAADEGVVMPWIGLGTGGYGSSAGVGYGGYPECFNEDSGCGNFTERAVLEWLGVGGRRLDCSNTYRNEKAIGNAIKKSGVRRDELFILSKVGPSSPLGYQDALDQFEGIKRDLQTDYVDLLLIHWPSLHKDSPASKDEACRPPNNDSTQCRLNTWRAMVKIWKSGGARAIGVSNYGETHLEEIVNSGLPLPALTQNPFHLYRSSTQQPVIDLCHKLGVVFNGYSPLGIPDWHTFPASSWDGMSPKQLEDPLVVSVANALGATSAQVLLAWQWQLGIPVNPRSQNSEHMAENLEAWKFRLNDSQMTALSYRPQCWCSVDPKFYECAPDKLSGKT